MVVLHLASQQPAAVGGQNAAVAAAGREDAGVLLHGWLPADGGVRGEVHVACGVAGLL